MTQPRDSAGAESGDLPALAIDPASADLRRVYRDGHPCTRIPTDVLRDQRLSATARGLYACLLSFLPGEDWRAGLAGQPESTEETAAAIRELEAAGYIAGGVL
jgi:hypothetical protein